MCTKSERRLSLVRESVPWLTFDLYSSENKICRIKKKMIGLHNFPNCCFAFYVVLRITFKNESFFGNLRRSRSSAQNPSARISTAKPISEMLTALQQNVNCSKQLKSGFFKRTVYGQK